MTLVDILSSDSDTASVREVILPRIISPHFPQPPLMLDVHRWCRARPPSGVSVETQTEDSDQVAELKEEIRDLSKNLITLLFKEKRCEIPAVKGRLGEDEIFTIFKANIPQGCTITMTRNLSRHTDFMLTYIKNGFTLGYALIDVKNYQGSVGSSQVDKLERDITFCTDKFHSPPVWAAIISLESNIAHKGVARAADYLFGPVRIHLVHNLNSSGNVNDAIRSLMTTGYLHVEAAHQPSVHRQLSDEAISKRNSAFAEIARTCAPKHEDSSSSMRGVPVPSRSRAMSAAAPRQRRNVTIVE